MNQSGPCIVCGETDYPLSMGGPSICPSCDCGVDPKMKKLRRELSMALAKNTSYAMALTKALSLPGLITPQMEAEADRVIAEFRGNSHR